MPISNTMLCLASYVRLTVELSLLLYNVDKRLVSFLSLSGKRGLIGERLDQRT